MTGNGMPMSHKRAPLPKPMSASSNNFDGAKRAVRKICSIGVSSILSLEPRSSAEHSFAELSFYDWPTS